MKRCQPIVSPPSKAQEPRSLGTPSSLSPNMIYERKGSLTAAYGSEEALVQHQQAKRPPLVLKSNVGRRNLDGHRLLFAACACLAGASLFGLLSVIVWTHHDKAQVTLEHDTQHTDPSSTSNHDKWSPSAVVLGPPTDSFRGM